MKKSVSCLALATLLFIPAFARAAEIGVNSATFFRYEQRAIPGFAKQTVIPATEFVDVNLEKIGDGNLSFHLFGWGRVDLADRSNDEGTTDSNLTYAYLDYHFPKANAKIKAGRIFINEGVAMEQIDGVNVRTDLQKGFNLAIFGGVPVKLDRDSKSKGDYIAGGRGSYRLKGLFELGVSGLQEGKVTLDPATDVKSDRQLVGGDIWLLPLPSIELNGHTFYNAATNGLAEHSYLLTLRPRKDLTLSGSYNEENFKNYFTFSNIRSLFNPDNAGEVKSYGGELTWNVATPLEVTADYRHDNRTSTTVADRNGSSDRYGGAIRLTLLDKKVRSGISYHRSDGASSFNSYDELRGYGLYDTSRYIFSFDGIAQIYKEKIFNKGEAFEVIASAGWRILSDLALSGEVSYGHNPRNTDEVRGLLRLNYNYTYASKGAKK